MQKLLIIPALLVATGCSQATDGGTFETTSEPLVAEGADGEVPAPPGEGRFERRFEHRFERLVERLGLHEAQAEAVRPILEGANARRMALYDLAPEERREAAEALHAEVRAELSQVLTEEQLGRLDAHFERRHERRGRGWRGRGRHGRGPGFGPGPGPGDGPGPGPGDGFGPGPEAPDAF